MDVSNEENPNPPYPFILAFWYASSKDLFHILLFGLLLIQTFPLFFFRYNKQKTKVKTNTTSLYSRKANLSMSIKISYIIYKKIHIKNGNQLIYKGKFIICKYVENKKIHIKKGIKGKKNRLDDDKLKKKGGGRL